jgi:hypothetical protein
MKVDNNMYKNICKMAEEDKVISKNMVDYMFKEMKAVMTLVNRNFKWGYVPESDWEDAYSELYLGMCKYIGNEITDKTDIFARLGRATAKYLFDSGKTVTRSKRKNMPMVYEADMKIHSNNEYTKEEVFEMKIQYNGIIDEGKAVEDSIENEHNKEFLKNTFKNDKYGLMTMLYDGYSIVAIADKIGMHPASVSGRIQRMRNRYLKIITNE